VHCDFSDRYKKIREDVRAWIDSHGSIYAIVDYTVLVNASKGYLENNVKFLTQFDITLKSPVIAFFNSKHLSYEMFIYSSEGNIGIAYLNFTPYTIETKTEFLKDDDCASKFQPMAIYWMDSWNDPHCFLLFACEVHKSKDPKRSYMVKKKLIILTDNQHNQSMVNFYISKNNYTRKYAKFDEFTSRGFCVCDDIKFYLEECGQQKNKDAEDPKVKELKYQFGIILLTFIVLFVVYEIYCCLMSGKSDTD
jgi:hypothetical protein